MARISGTGGSVDLGGSITGITDWTINYTAETPDATGMDSTLDDIVRGLSSWTISCNGHWESSSSPDPATDIPATSPFAISISDGTNTYTGNAYMTRFHIEATQDGTVDFSIDAQGTGGFTT